MVIFHSYANVYQRVYIDGLIDHLVVGIIAHGHVQIVAMWPCFGSETWGTILLITI